MNRRISVCIAFLTILLLSGLQGQTQNGQTPQPGKSAPTVQPGQPATRQPPGDTSTTPPPGQNGMQFHAPGSDSVKTVLILNDDRYRFEQRDSGANRIFLVGNVRLQEDRTLIFCDSMIHDSRENHIECFGHVRIFDGDSTNIYSDYMNYDALHKNVLFQKSVRLTDGKGVLTTQELHYDLNTKIGIYTHGGKVVNNGSVLTSDEATYFEENKDVYFRQHVVLRNPQYDLSADSLLYNTETQVSHFITETFIQFKDTTERTVHTKEGYYDLKSRKAYFGKRPIIVDGTQRLTGDSVLIDDSTHISIATGNAVYKDSVQGIAVIANYMISNQKRGTFLATQRPLMIVKQEKDSIYITGDTIYSGRLIDAEAEAVKTAIEDSLHQHYVDSLYQVSSDSLHRVSLQRHHLAQSDTALAGGADSTHHIIEKDESRDRHFDSLHMPASDSSHSLTGFDSLHAVSPGDTLHHATAGDTLHHATARDSSSTKAAAAAALTHAAAAPSVVERVPDKIPTALPPERKITKASVVAARAEEGRRLSALADDSSRQAAALREVSRRAAADSTRKAMAALAAAQAPPPTKDSSIRYIKVFHHVRIFSDSLQAVSDSLFYSGKDSIFRLFKDPIAWGSGNYQVTGDTIFIYTKNKKVDRLYVFENAIAINKIGTNFYNQMKGTTINGYFKDGQMDFMRAKGSAESIYYIRDDNKAYTGVNKANSDIIDMIFVNKELNRVVFRSDVEGSMIPFRKVDFDEMRLRGFKWQEDRRPKTKFELF